MKIVLVLLVLLLAFSAWQHARHEGNERRLALVASEVVLRDVDVDCPGFWGRLLEDTPYGGWVESGPDGRPERKTSLSAETCGALARLWRAERPPAFGCLLDERKCPRSTLDVVGALVVLAHESWHMRGLVDEAQVQCYAVQTVELVAGGFGVPSADARAIGVYVALEDARSPEGRYHSGDCRPGGPLDLYPSTRRWPTG